MARESAARQIGASGTSKASIFEIKDYRTVRYPQAADLLGVSVRTVKRMVKAGKLEFTRVGAVKGVGVYVWSIEAYKARRTGLLL